MSGGTIDYFMLSDMYTLYSRETFYEMYKY